MARRLPRRRPLPLTLSPVGLALLATLAAGVGGGAGAQQPAEPPPLFVERVDVDVVNVEVFVTDRQGRRVTGLERDDFELFEDGRSVEISNFYRVDWSDPLRLEPEPAAGGPGGAVALPPPRREVPRDQQLHLVVYVDHAHLFPGRRRQVLEELEGFFEDRLIEGDDMMLVSYDRTLRVEVPFTRDLGRLLDGLREMSEGAALGPQIEAQRRQTMVSMAFLAQTAADNPNAIFAAHDLVRSYSQAVTKDLERTATALERIVRSLAGLPGRKALLYVGGGLPQRPGEDLYQHLIDLFGTNTLRETRDSGALIDPSIESLANDQSHLFRRVTRAANSNQVTLYTLDTTGAGGASALSPEHGYLDTGVGEGGRVGIDMARSMNLAEPMIELAAATGGTAVLNTNNFDEALTAMASDFDSYYSLGYRAPQGGDGDYHRISVRVKRPGLTLRHRTGYVDRPAAERVADRTLSSLLLDLESNPLAIDVTFGAPEHHRKDLWHLPVMVRVPLSEITLLPNGELREGRLEIFVVVRDDRGGVSEMHRQNYPLRIPQDELAAARGRDIGYFTTLELRAGSPRVAVGVWDELSGEESFVQREVPVGEPEGRDRRGRRARRARGENRG